jgi:predicted nucleic acid-binding protein
VTRIFLDATTLIALGTIGEIEQLMSFTGTLVVLPTVQNEVTTEPAQTNLSRFIAQNAVATADPVVQDRVEQAKEVLGEAERNGDVSLIAAVLAYTAEDRPVGVVSDDKRVRTTARGLGATVTGTVGVIVRAVEEGLDREEAHDLIRRIDSHGLHMTGTLREKADELIDEAAE